MANLLVQKIFVACQTRIYPFPRASATPPPPAVFEEFEQDYLADVFRVWDGYKQEWADPFITLFRFESDDVLVWCDKGGLKYECGRVDTSDRINTFDSLKELDSSKNSCICWLRDDSFDSFIGQPTIAHDLLETFM